MLLSSVKVHNGLCYYFLKICPKGNLKLSSSNLHIRNRAANFKIRISYVNKTPNNFDTMHAKKDASMILSTKFGYTVKVSSKCIETSATNVNSMLMVIGIFSGTG